MDVLVFGDTKWFYYHKDKPEFKAFRNPKITNHKKLKDEEGIIWAPREDHGFHRHALGWNGNTGSAAINVALLLGAGRIFLIGFDMALDNGASNWHENPLDDPTEDHYRRYMDEMSRTMPQIANKWPGVKIINLNPASAMGLFPRMAWEEAFGGKDEKFSCCGDGDCAGCDHAGVCDVWRNGEIGSNQNCVGVLQPAQNV